MLVHGQVILPFVKGLEMCAEPVGEPEVDEKNGFPLTAAAYGCAHAAGLVGDHARKPFVQCACKQGGLAVAGVPHYGNATCIHPGIVLQVVHCP